MPTKTMNRSHIGCLGFLLLVAGASEVSAQTVEPFTVQEVIALLQEGMPQARIMEVVAQGCVDRGDEGQVQRQLEQAGASTALMRTVAAFACAGPVPVVAVRLLSAPASLQQGETTRLEVRVLGPEGQEFSEREVEWTVGDGAVLSVTAGGELRGVSPGRSYVRATVDTVSAVAQVVVLGGPALIDVQPSEFRLSVGEERSFSVSIRDQAGNILDRNVQSTTADPGIATVDEGRLRALGPGETSLIVFSDGQSPRRIPIRVTEASERRVEVRPWLVELRVGESLTLEAFLISSRPNAPIRLSGNAGDAIPASMATWRSTDPSVVTVSASAEVVARREGTASIVVEVEGVRTEVPVQISSAGPNQPRVWVGPHVLLRNHYWPRGRDWGGRIDLRIRQGRLGEARLSTSVLYGRDELNVNRFGQATILMDEWSFQVVEERRTARGTIYLNISQYRVSPVFEIGVEYIYKEVQEYRSEGGLGWSDSLSLVEPALATGIEADIGRIKAFSTYDLMGRSWLIGVLVGGW